MCCIPLYFSKVAYILHSFPNVKQLVTFLKAMQVKLEIFSTDEAKSQDIITTMQFLA